MPRIVELMDVSVALPKAAPATATQPSCKGAAMANTQNVGETCDNCGRQIGRLETPHVLGNHVVCAECLARLSPPSRPRPRPIPPPIRSFRQPISLPPSPVPQAQPDRTKWLWIGGVLLILAGFGSLRGFPQLLTAPFLIVAGALLLPPVWAQVVAQWPDLGRYSTLIRTLACVLAFAVVGLLMPEAPARSKSSSSSSYSPPAPVTSTPRSVPATELNWYDGGTLHKKTVKDWRVATYENRLATAADFVTATSKSRGISFASMDQVKDHAVALEREISAAGEGGYADNQPVSQVAAACLVLMGKQ